MCGAHQVIGVPDKRMGEELCAWIRLKHEHKHMTAEDIKHFCKGKVMFYIQGLKFNICFSIKCMAVCIFILYVFANNITV